MEPITVVNAYFTMKQQMRSLQHVVAKVQSEFLA